MTNLEINELARNAEFRKIVEAAIIIAAINVSGEDDSALTAIQAQKRHNLATNVINAPQQNHGKFAGAIATQAGLNSVITINPDKTLNYIGTGSIDGDVLYTVSTVWDDMAGVSFADIQPPETV